MRQKRFVSDPSGHAASVHQLKENRTDDIINEILNEYVSRCDLARFELLRRLHWFESQKGRPRRRGLKRSEPCVCRWRSRKKSFFTAKTMARSMEAAASTGAHGKPTMHERRIRNAREESPTWASSAVRACTVAREGRLHYPAVDLLPAAKRSATKRAPPG